MDDFVVYRVYSMHGPTVFESSAAGFAKLIQRVWDMSRNAGPYRVVYLPTGEVVARFDRSDDGSCRPGMDTVHSALNR